MKKRLVAVLIVVVMCLAALSGCSLIKGLERDVQVILMGVQQTESGDLVTNDDGSYQYEYVGTYTVNQFNNAIVPEPDYAPDGMQFAGWSPIKDWTEDDGIESVSSSKGLIRYDDVKNFVDGESLSITLYAAFAPIPQHDLVIAWYDKESTSGINQAWMDQFQTNLYAFLTTEGYTPESMDIIIRGYSGNVGPSCSEIMDDGDVDIMYGWGGNIDSTGGMVEGVDYLENVSGIEINGKNRYAARLSDKELVNLVYNWIIGRDETPDIDPNPDPEPTPDPEPSEGNELVVAWYDLKGTSGLDEYIISLFSSSLESYVASADNGAYADYVVELRAYDDDVATSCGNIKADGDVDIMVGWGGNIGSKGGMVKDTDYLEHISGIPMGGETRYITRISDDDVTKSVFAWLQTAEGQEGLAPVEISEFELVIGWYAKTSTTGLDQALIDSFTTSLTSYVDGLEAAMGEGVSINVVIREYEAALDVAGVGEKVNAAGDVDILLGMGKNITSTGKIEVIERVDDYTMGGKGRNIARLTADDLTVIVFSWLKTDEVRALFA